jgi:hypothetical protein
VKPKEAGNKLPFTLKTNHSFCSIEGVAWGMQKPLNKANNFFVGFYFSTLPGSYISSS